MARYSSPDAATLPVANGLSRRRVEERGAQTFYLLWGALLAMQTPIGDRPMQRFFATGLVIAKLAMATGCSHQVVIDSIPPGANVRIDGVERGETPLAYNETSGWGRTYRLEISKPGFETRETTLTQSRWNLPVVAAVGAVPFVFGWGCGLMALPGLLFAKQSPDELVVELEAVSEQENPETVPKNTPLAQLAY